MISLTKTKQSLPCSHWFTAAGTWSSWFMRLLVQILFAGPWTRIVQQFNLLMLLFESINSGALSKTIVGKHQLLCRHCNTRQKQSFRPFIKQKSRCNFGGSHRSYGDDDVCVSMILTLKWNIYTRAAQSIRVWSCCIRRLQNRFCRWEIRK